MSRLTVGMCGRGVVGTTCRPHMRTWRGGRHVQVLQARLQLHQVRCQQGAGQEGGAGRHHAHLWGRGGDMAAATAAISVHRYVIMHPSAAGYEGSAKSADSWESKRV